MCGEVVGWPRRAILEESLDGGVGDCDENAAWCVREFLEELSPRPGEAV